MKDRHIVNAAMKQRGKEEGGENESEICTESKHLTETSGHYKLFFRINISFVNEMVICEFL
jgi:hypothetical protein